MKKQRIEHFIVLIAILVGGIAAFLYVSPNNSLQFIIGVITSVTYVLWGLTYHAIQKDLHKKVVVEYVLMGLIAIILLATILKR